MCPKVITHRGSHYNYQENSLEAFQCALDEGADAFECDVALTRDGEPVIIHLPFFSDNLRELTKRDIFLSKTDWKDLKDIDISGGHIAHLDDVLAFIKDNPIECFIEPKHGSPLLINKICEKIVRHDLTDKTHLLTFYIDRSLLTHGKRMFPEVRTSLILISPFGNWSQIVEEYNVSILTPGWKGYNYFRLLDTVPIIDIKRKIQCATNNNILIYSGIADTEVDIRWLCEIGVQGIFTNNTSLAATIASEYP